MTEDTRANEIAGTPQEPMPSSEQQSQEATPVEGNIPTRLPEDASQRTRTQFEKLQTQLAEEKARRAQAESLFESLRVGNAPYQTEGAEYAPNVYGDDLENRIQTAEERASRAEREVQSWTEDQQSKEALEAHPDLDPKSKDHNKSFYKATRAILLDSIINPQDYSGRQLSYKEAADLAKSMNNKELSEAERVGAEKALEQLSPKEQAALEATGRSDRRTSAESAEELSYRTQHGDLDAIMARLKKIPPVAR